MSNVSSGICKSRQVRRVSVLTGLVGQDVPAGKQASFQHTYTLLMAFLAVNNTALSDLLAFTCDLAEQICKALSMCRLDVELCFAEDACCPDCAYGNTGIYISGIASFEVTA